MANNFYAGFNPDLLRPGFMPKIPETLTPSPRTQSPLGPFINPGIGQALGQAVQQYQPAPQPQSMGSRIQGILGTLLGAQNKSELSKGLLDFGARMMAASAPGPNTSFLGALGQSLPGTRDALEGQRQMGQMDALAEQYGIPSGLPPQAMMALLMDRARTQSLAPGETLIRGAPGGVEEMYSAPVPTGPRDPDVNTDEFFDQAMVEFGYTNFDSVDPADRPLISQRANLLRSIDAQQRTPGVADPFAEGEAKYWTNTLNDIRDGARAARTNLDRLSTMGNLVDSEGVYQGFAGNKVAAARKFADAMGIPQQGLGDSELLAALGARAALELRNPAGGAGMPGAMSDKDREFLERMVPSLSQTEEGNARLIEYMRAVEQRKVEVQRAAAEYRRRHGRLDDGFFDFLDDRFGDSGLFEGEPGYTTTPTSGIRF